MTKYTVQVKTSNDDQIVATDTPTNIIDFTLSNGDRALEKYLWMNRDLYHLEYLPVLVDLYRLAASVFIIDKTTPRDTAYDRWTREIVLYVPVSDPQLWQKNSDLIIKLLSFLTGDHWQIVFTKDNSVQPQRDERLNKKGHRLDAKSVCLFSGGLDSFIGAIDQITTHNSVALVAHFDQGHTSKVQKEIYSKIVSRFPSAAIELMQFFLQPHSSLENTTRSRSLLFLSLGTIITSSLGVKELVVPENGLISLNVPLTYSRFGSLSTKTTHPNTLKMFNDLLKGLDIDVSVVDPYKFKTKGEMLTESRDFEFAASVGNETMSCAHATVGRWEGRSPNTHCGYCLPCLIRRAAFHRNNLDNSEHYTFDVLDPNFLNNDSRKTDDLRAVLYSLEGRKTTPTVTNILRTGSIFPLGGIDDFCKVYENGLQELENFLSIYKD